MRIIKELWKAQPVAIKTRTLKNALGLIKEGSAPAYEQVFNLL